MNRIIMKYSFKYATIMHYAWLSLDLLDYFVFLIFQVILLLRIWTESDSHHERFAAVT